MGYWNLGRHALTSFVAAALLAGCGGAPGSPLASAVPQSRSHGQPGATGDLIYVTNVCGGACIFSYPGGKLAGVATLNAVGAPCADASGNVFIPVLAGSQDDIFEYAHGGTLPTAKLAMPYPSNDQGCSVDPVTGNLAAAYQASPGSNGVAIFQNAQGAPTLYQDAQLTIEYCGYDNQGNLFVDGAGNASHPFGFAELPKGASEFTDISVNVSVQDPGQVQWDGQYITVEDLSGKIYRLTISGSQASVVGTTTFTKIKKLKGTSWIDGDSVISMYQKGQQVQRALGFWKYPAGDTHRKSISSWGLKLRGSKAMGVTISRG
ncbi:MAG TPA: hypothetical protein VMU38_06170 [Candidatus Binatia bacterium]|nr:hypothetical protein [Candidatus Binatia bacterium]